MELSNSGMSFLYRQTDQHPGLSLFKNSFPQRCEMMFLGLCTFSVKCFVSLLSQNFGQQCIQITLDWMESVYRTAFCRNVVGNPVERQNVELFRNKLTFEFLMLFETCDAFGSCCSSDGGSSAVGKERSGD